MPYSVAEQMMQTAFTDLPDDAFPFLVEYFNVSGDLVHTIRVDSPGVVHVPALSSIHGPVGVVVTFANGECISEPAPPA